MGMQNVYDREVTLHSRNAQGRNALTERAGRAAVFYKPAHARKTQPGAWRRLAAVALCCGALLCAFRLYGRARSRFGVQLPVRTVLQNPELPNGCEAASLAALLKYKGVPADKLDLAYGYIPRGDIEETTDGRTGLLADTGETYVPYANLHCVVLAGWDGDTCTIADPLQGRRRVDAAAFLQCFRQMGSRAVVVH